ncbi:transcriptional regulatory protein ZraR [bacterium BMS3Abin04]|nr:transcriptional regulatory protein ZraR [bacterium BMS3Abin04]
MTASLPTILIIDDEGSQLLSLKSFLTRRNYKVLTAPNGKDGFDVVRNNTVDIVLTDFRMPEWDGYEVLKQIKKLNPGIDVVIMTAFGSVEDAVNIMKAGAYDYITKPIDLDELENLLGRITEKRTLIYENKQLKEQLIEKFRVDTIISQSKKMEEVLNTVARVANSKATILILGESGTGKELIAKAIHYASDRKDKPFITVNVASLPDNLIESELFGHEKGAFTGAVAQRIGRFEEANGGTLFIDEVGDIPLSVQVKILRVIQFGEIQKVGSNKTISIDVRIVAATNRNLEEMIKSQEFREDLYYRLNVIQINIPPLRERKEDIPVLIDHFIDKFNKQNNADIQGLDKKALDRLMKYDYPGNIRELENIIERAVILARNNVITSETLPAQFETAREISLLDPQNLTDGYEKKVKAFEKDMIKEALRQTNGNKSAAARLLNITERHLRSRLERLGMK